MVGPQNLKPFSRSAFDGFEPQRIARYDEAKLASLMADAGIIRNRAKIEASVISARAYLDLSQTRDFSSFLWDFVDGVPLQNQWRERGQVPAETDLSRRMSKALLEKGFKFCGPTIVYAFMQAVGMVNDHFVDCCRHAECAALAGSGKHAHAHAHGKDSGHSKDSAHGKDHGPAKGAKRSPAKPSRPKGKASK